jgi:hypothetical protein
VTSSVRVGFHGRQPLDRGRNRKIASFRTAARRRLELDDHNIWTDHSLGESRRIEQSRIEDDLIDPQRIGMRKGV